MLKAFGCLQKVGRGANGVVLCAMWALSCVAEYSAARADVHVQETPAAYLLRASGPHGYTASIDRSDGHLSTLSCGDGETFSEAPVSPLAAKDAPSPAGWMSVVAGDKLLLSRGAAAKVSTPRVERDAVSIAVTLADGSTLTYRAEPERLGIQAGAACDLVLNWNRGEVAYTLPDRTVFGSLESWSGDAAPVIFHAHDTRATLSIVPSGDKPATDKMTLEASARFSLSDKPLWISARGATPQDELPFLKLVSISTHESDQAFAWWNWPEPVSEYGLVDKLSLAPGEAITAHMPLFPNGVHHLERDIPSPRFAVYALDITNGDPQLLREGRHPWPEIYPALEPVNWTKLAATYDNRVLRAPTTGLKAGVYRMRLALGNGGAPQWVIWGKAYEEPSPIWGLWGDFYVVIGSSSGASFDLTTEANRRVYYRGEEVPLRLTVRSASTLASGEAKLTLSRGAQVLTSGAVKIPALKNASQRAAASLQTEALSPGEYSLRATYAGQSATWPIEIVDPVSPSIIAISESQIPSSPFAQTELGNSFPEQGVDSLAHGLAAPYADLQITTFRNQLDQGVATTWNSRLAETLEAVNAGPSGERIALYDLRQKWMDGMTRLRMGYWQGVNDRQLSFSKPNTLQGTEDAERTRLVNRAREYWSYANFFGPQGDVDTGALPGYSQLFFAGVPNDLAAAFQKRVTAAQNEDFQKLYAKEIAAAVNDPVAQKHLYNNYLRSIWSRVDARDEAALHELDPTLALTGNREYHHGFPQTGQYAPDLYCGLDVHQVEVWGDAIDNVIMADAWTAMATASRRAYRRPEQPIWMETQDFFGDVAGYLQTRWWGVLANGGDGVGYAANVFGLRQFSGIAPHVPNWRRQTGATMARLVRTIGPALRASQKESHVAVFFSKSEADVADGYNGWYNIHAFGTQPPFVTFFGLAMAGYSPDYILEEQILQGDLKRYKAIYLTLQNHPLPADVQAKIDEFVKGGGKIILDASSTASLFPNAIQVPVDTRNYHGPHSFGGPEDWAWIDESVPKLQAALDGVLAPPGRATHPRVATYWLRGGDAQYCLVINEGYAPIQTELKLAAPLSGYDLISGARIERTDSINVDFRNSDFRIYAFTPQAVGKLATRATQNAMAGQNVGIAANVLGEDGKPLSILAPAIFRISDASGKTVWQRWTPLGAGQAPAIWDTASTQPAGEYSASVTELLSGQTASFPVRLSAPIPTTVSLRPSIEDKSTPVAIRERDARNLGRLWNERGAAWSVVIEPSQAQRLPKLEALVKTLNARGLKVSLWKNPLQISMPVGFDINPEQKATRDRVFSGEAIGWRYYVHGNDGDKRGDGPMWEPKGGPALYRNAIFIGQPGESTLLDSYGAHLDAENAATIHVGIRELSGDNDVVFITGRGEADLTTAINYALSLKADGGTLVGPEAGRRAFKAGAGLPVKNASTPTVAALVPVAARESKTELTWNEQVGRPISSVLVSPDGKYVVVKHHGIVQLVGEYSNDGKVARVLARPSVGSTGDSDVYGVSGDGSLLLSTAGGITPLKLDGTSGKEQPNVLWHSADDTETIGVEKVSTEEKTADGKTQNVSKPNVVRRKNGAVVFSSFELAQIPGGVTADPMGQYLWDAGVEPQPTYNIGLHHVQMFDAHTGKLLWKKDAWWDMGRAWSADGKFIAVIRHYNNVDHHGVGAMGYNRVTVSLVRASDGQVVAEGNPTTRPNRVFVADDDSFAVAVPAFMADHFWLLRPGSEMQKITASKTWLYDATLIGSDLVTLDMDGVLRRQRASGETVWTSNALVRASSAISYPLLGSLTPLGDDVIVGGAAGQVLRVSGADGKVLWRQTTAERYDADKS